MSSNLVYSPFLRQIMAGEEEDPMAEANQEKKGKTPVSEEELKVAFSGPAIYANKFYLTLSGTTARIAFTEVTQGVTPAFRAAVAMTLNDLLQLRDLIDAFSKDFEIVEIKAEKRDG